MNPLVQKPAQPQTSPGILRPIEHLSRVLITGTVLLLAVFLFGLFLSKSTAVTAFDLGIDRSLSRLQVAPLTGVARGVYTLFSPLGAIALTVVAALIIWAASRNWLSALTFSVVVAVSWVSSDVVKMIVHRPRPSAAALAHPYLPTPVDSTFPSGHVVFAASIAIAFMFLARNAASRALVVVVGVVGAVLTGLAVVYLGVHYPTDAIASLVWAAGACTIVLGVWNGFVIPRIRRAPVTTIDR